MRRIQAPGIEINEIDKSAYNEQFDESLVDTTSLMCGFADKGQDYEPQYINSMNQFIDAYGYPTNEAERYFYYGAKEVLDNRGQLICAKLPYDNNVLDKICYTTYSLNNKLVEISTVFSIIDQDLLNINLSVHQVIPNNSFFDVLNMVKLGKTGFESLAEFNNEKISKYSEDLIDFAFNTCNVSLDKWNTYEKYCKSSFVGVHTFLKLLNYKIPSERDFEQAIETDLNNYLKDEDNYPYTNVHADIPLQNFSDLEDLEKIAIKMYKTYKNKMAISENGESISSLFDYIAKDFVMQKSLFQIKQYFYDLGSYIEPYFNEIKEHDDTDFKKISIIYNYISNNVKYNKNIGDIKYSAYSAYENKTAICQGYSTLLYKMLKEADIEDVRVIRSATHSWNIVRIGNKYYHLDSTWEATSSKKGKYNYFLKGSNEISKLNKHKVDSEYKTKKFKKEYPISSEDYLKTQITKIKIIKNKKIKIRWKENIYSNGYQIQYSTKSNYSTDSKKIKITNNNNTTKTISDIKNRKKYYYRVRTYIIVNGKKVYSKWSKTKTYKI